MWHNVVWIGGIWLIATAIAWLICAWRGYSVAAWALTIAAFCLGIFIGTENTRHGKFNVPFLAHHYAHRHLIAHWR